MFADTVNYALFGGEKVINPDDLIEQDTTELAIPFNVNGTEMSVQKIRDALKLCEIKDTATARYMIIGVENQSEIHYAMPVKIMLYNALNYASQVEMYRKKHKEAGDNMQSPEFLSGMTKDEKLIPVITIVVLWNDQKWDAPKSISEMLDMPDEMALKYSNDFKLNIIEPSQIEDFSKFDSDLGKILNCVKEKSNKEGLKELFEKHEDFFSNLDGGTAYLIKELLGFTGRMKKNKKGGFNMCVAFETERKAGEKIGMEKGIKKGVEKGELKMAKLTNTLLMAKRFEELQRATTDKTFREKLYKDLNI